VRAKIADGVHVAAGFRKSYLDSVLPVFTSQDVGDIVPIPRYWDAQGRLAWEMAPHETIEVGVLASSDRIANTLLNPDPSLTERQTTGTDFQRIYLRYEKHMTDSSVVTIDPWFGWNTTSLANSFGSTVTDVTNDSTLVGLRADWHGPIVEHVRGAVGLDFEMQFSSLHRDGSIGAPPREGDIYVFGEPPPPQINTDNWKTVIGSFAPYAEADIAAFDETLHIVPGVRLDPFITSVTKTIPTVGTAPDVGVTTSDVPIEPRISVRYAFTPEIAVKAAYGQYHQAPQAEDLSAVFGTPTLALSSAQHYLGGGIFQLTQSLSVEMTAFLSEMKDLAVRSQSESPSLSHALDQIGIGRAYGTQFLLRQQQVGRFFGWVSYSILRSERKDAPGLDWRLFDYDQTHVFTALGSYDLGSGWEVGLRFRYATGYPRTPVVGAVGPQSGGVSPINGQGAYQYNLTNTYEPIFGAHNSIRIPPFYALDARISKKLKIARTALEVYLDVQNVSNHPNPEEIVYNTNYTQRGYITGFPLLPVVGARLSW
jgi:hypothetical protein